MSYLALARKWRPRTFYQLVGQDHINKALIKSLNQQKLHHAYLFTGTRGVGKTSVARLMAKALNCEQGVSANPCLQCEACIAIEQNRFIDLIEIDAASKTRVEDTRDILENVQYAPTAGRYKIYLIDEIHMLSQHSFNALLKTLEEPPEHVKFLLATTDPQKIPVTILSRCLQFNLKHLSPEIIAAHLQLILNEEQYPFEEGVLPLLAKAAQGSMRDALSLLDQAIASSDNSLLTDEVKTILGYTHQDYALQLLQALVCLDAPSLIKLCRQVADEGGHFHYVLEELLDYLHQITLQQSIPEGNALLDARQEIALLAKQISPEDIQLFYQIGINGIEEMSLAPTMSIGFEMTLLRMLTFKPVPQVAIPTLAHQEIEPCVSSPSLCLSEKNPSIKLSEPMITPSTPTAPEPSLNWESILNHIKLVGLAQNAAENSQMLNKTGGRITLGVASGHQSLFTPSTTQRIEQALTTYFQEPIKITLEFNDSISSTPAQKRNTIHHLNHQEAEASLQQDAFLEKLKQEFSAELVKNSIESHQDQL